MEFGRRTDGPHERATRCRTPCLTQELVSARTATSLKCHIPIPWNIVILGVEMKIAVGDCVPNVSKGIRHDLLGAGEMSIYETQEWI